MSEENNTLLGEQGNTEPTMEPTTPTVPTTPPADNTPAKGDTLLTQPDKTEAAPEGAPESYEDFNVPEGFDLNADALGAFTPIAKELNLNQEGAQKLIDMYANIQTKETEAYAAKVASWEQEVKSDPEIGGPALEGALANSAKAINKFGGDPLRKLLNDSGLGNHKEFIKFFAAVGKSISEDQVITNSKGGGGQEAKTITDVLPQGTFAT